MQNKIRFEIFKRDNFTCQYCGRKAPDVILQVDHKTPIAKGGQDDLGNLITACTTCNHGKAANDIKKVRLESYKSTEKKGYELKYKQFKVPAVLHSELKMIAARKGITLIELLKELTKQKLF